MSRHRGSANKRARREGTDLGLKTAGSSAHSSLLRRINIRPGQHGQKRRRKQSDFARQLREKQKVKQMYGIIEKQFQGYFEKASNVRGVTGELLLQQLEQRLDNVVYRMGLAPTRPAARQFVRHGHIRVNEKSVDIPSYHVEVGDVIRLRDQSMSIPVIQETLQSATHTAPAWMQVKGGAAKIMQHPTRDDIPDDIEEQLIVEYYSR